MTRNSAAAVNRGSGTRSSNGDFTSHSSSSGTLTYEQRKKSVYNSMARANAEGITPADYLQKEYEQYLQNDVNAETANILAQNGYYNTQNGYNNTQSQSTNNKKNSILYVVAGVIAVGGIMYFVLKK